MARVKDLWKMPARHGRGKRWLAVWIGPDGRERTKAFATKAVAARYAASQEADAARGTYIDPRAARVTIGEWVQAVWLPGYERHRLSTVRQARTHIRQIEAEFGGMAFGAVRPSHVRSWTARLLAEGYAPSYVYALHGRLGQIFSDAVHDGVVPRSPVGRRTSPGLGKPRPYVATTAQIWALHDAMPAQLRPAILLGAFAGLRLAEVCALRVADVDFMRGVIYPAIQWPGVELKTEMSRTAIPIPASMALELSAVVRSPDNGTLLGAPPWTLDRTFRAVRGRVEGLPEGFRFHDLRHYFASLLIASGADVKTVQSRLRHASASTTLDVYGHMFPDRDESTRAAVEAVFKIERNRDGTAGSRHENAAGQAAWDGCGS
jgi:integrase